MDIRFTYSTVLTAVILSSVIFVSLFLYIGKKDTAYSMAEVYAVMACFLFSLVRLVFPIEILHLTKSIYLFKVYPIIYDCSEKGNFSTDKNRPYSLWYLDPGSRSGSWTPDISLPKAENHH